MTTNDSEQCTNGDEQYRSIRRPGTLVPSMNNTDNAVPAVQYCSQVAEHGTYHGPWPPNGVQHAVTVHSVSDHRRHTPSCRIRGVSVSQGLREASRPRYQPLIINNVRQYHVCTTVPGALTVSGMPLLVNNVVGHCR